MDNTVFATEEELKTKKNIVYLIINTVNNKMYVGVTQRTFNLRYKSSMGWWNAIDNEHLKSSILKHKPENFKIQILEENKTEEELSYFEILYIRLFGTLHKDYGYNVASGGLFVAKHYLKDVKQFKLDLFKIHGDKLDYSYIRYKGVRKPVKMYCNICNIFFYKGAKSLMAGVGCPECGNKIKREAHTYTLEGFIQKANKVHGEKYIYKNFSKINNIRYINYECKDCKTCVEQKLASHLEGRGCPPCANIEKGKKTMIPFGKVLSVVKMKFDKNWEIKKDTFINITNLMDLFCLVCNAQKRITFNGFKKLMKPVCECGLFDNSIINKNFKLRNNENL